MTLYFTLILLILLSSLIKNNGEIILHFFVATLIFILGYRTLEVGTDTVNYKMYFDVIENGVFLPVEIGWLAINNLVILFNGGFKTLLLVVTLLTLIPIYFICKNYSKNPSLSLFFYLTLYFYFYSFNISRQILAISFVLYAFHFLKENKKLSFVLFVFIAASFHTSALVVLPLLFVNLIPDKNILYISSIVSSALFGIFGTHLIYEFISLTTYSNYLEKLELGAIYGNALYILLLNSFFLFVLYFSDKREVYFKIFFIYIFLSNILVRIPLGNRLMMYFSIIQVLFLPLFLYSSKKDNKILIISVVILYAIILFLKKFGSGDILPYSNYLFN